MIERCNYCGETHDVGDAEFFGGVPYKTCPKIPPQKVMFFDPRYFKAIYDDAVHRPFGLSLETKEQLDKDYQNLRVAVGFTEY